MSEDKNELNQAGKKQNSSNEKLVELNYQFFKLYFYSDLLMA